MWIPSKLTRPARLHNAILRPRVLESLQQAPFYKLVLFRSPAGYGKTTMAAQWLSEKPHTGWYSLDDSDNDTFRFVNYLIQAINKSTNNACPNTQTLAERRQFASLPSLFSELFGELHAFHQELYVVLDDYHLITNDDIHEGMRFFLKHMPDNVTLVVTSRTQPALGTANLRVRDLLIEIDNDSLAFDDDETERFFTQRIHEDVDQDTVHHLRSQVEGWASALQLIALHAQQHKHSLAQSVQSMANFNRGHLWDYLAEEVFDQLDSDTQQFLTQCSILDTFNAELVTELTGRPDALSRLESLNRFGLFLHTLEGAQNWFRFHNLFAEFLNHQRQTTIPDQENQLHCVAARAWLKQSSPQQALAHARKAKNAQVIADILSDYGWMLFHHGELTLLEAAIDDLNADVLFTSPRLALLRAWLAQSQHRYNQVGELLKETEHELAQRNIVLDDSLQGEFNALRAQVAINQSNPQQALELSEQALGQLESNTYRSRIVATSVVGEVHHVLGQLNRSLPMMQQTEKMARQYHVYHQALWAMLQQSEILIAQGYVQSAFDLQDQAFKLIEEQHMQQVPLHEFLLRIRAQILWCWNRLDEAEECAHKGLQVLAHYDETKFLPCYSMLARIAISRGELDKAARYIELCQGLMDRSDYHIDWTANAHVAQLLYWQATNETDAIQHWLEQAEKPDGACNHFQQLQWRNIVRASLICGHYEQASDLLTMMQTECENLNLLTDKNRNMILEVILHHHQGDENAALAKLTAALVLTNNTGMVGNFLVDGKEIAPLLQMLLDSKQLGDLERHRAQQLLKEMSSKERSRSVHFDESFVEKLINHPDIPELIRTSPLTQREWQVLGLIYAGYSNEQIASELDVASTTIKTHIRNLYQKLNIANRQQAIETAEKLLKLMGY